jgi:hypothetical protein
MCVNTKLPCIGVYNLQKPAILYNESTKTTFSILLFDIFSGFFHYKNFKLGGIFVKINKLGVG